MNAIDMAPSVVLVLAIGVLFAAGVYLLLERSLTRVLLEFILMGNGANLLFLVAGGRRRGSTAHRHDARGGHERPARPGDGPHGDRHHARHRRSCSRWPTARGELHGRDEVQDDLEDRRVARHAARSAPAFEDADTEESGATLDDEAAEVRDETDGDGDGVADGEPPSGPAGQDAGDATDGRTGGSDARPEDARPDDARPDDRRTDGKEPR